jgi:pimeloyl-ACP methyl ester carboxylesterase
MRRALAFALPALLIALAACTQVETTEPTPVTVAQFDPAPVSPDEEHLVLPSVPSPSNLLMDPATGKVNLPLQVALDVLGKDEPVVVDAFTTPTAAQLAQTYLNSLSGFPRDSAFDTGFAGRAIQAESVNAETVRVYDVTALLTDAGEVTAVEDIGLVLGERDEETGKTPLRILPPDGQLWEQGHTYAAVITSDVLDITGAPVRGTYVFNLLKSTEPLLNGEGRSRCALPDVKAVELEALRGGMYEPILDGLASDLAGGPFVERADLALAFLFTIRPDAIALNDPLAGIFPTPNDLIMTSPAGSKHDCDGDGKKDCASGHLCFPIDCENDPPAQKDFFAYMNSLDGWPASMSISAAFSRPLEPQSVTPDAVGLVAMTGGEPKPVDFHLALDEAGTGLTMRPVEPFAPGTKYVAWLKSDLMTEGNLYEVRPSTVTAVTRLTEPVFAEGKSRLADFGVDDSQAVLLEIMRLGADVLLKALGFDTSRDRIASLWSFVTQSHNEALYDPTAGILPYPNDLLMSLDSKGNPERVNLPIDPTWPAAQQELVAELNKLDGFSPLGTTHTRFLLSLDPLSFHFVNAMTDLVGQGLGESLSLAVADVTEVDPGGGVAGMTPLMDPANIYGEGEVEATSDFGMLSLTPLPGQPLPAGRRFMVVAFDNLRSKETDKEGTPVPIEVAPVFHMARMLHPLFDAESGKSNVLSLTDEAAAQLEQLRQQYDAIFTALESEMVGIPRERVLMFWTFTTQSIGSWFHVLKKKLVTLSIGPGKAPGTIEEGTGSGLEFADKVVFDGSFGGFSALAAADFTADPPELGRMRFDADGVPDWQAEALPFLFLVPKAHDEIQPPFPIVILQHGLYGNKEEVLAQADRFLEAGYAVASMDLPFHGDRAVAGDGTGFFSADAVATRDHLVEASFDIVQLIAYLANGNSGFKLWFTQQTGQGGLIDTDRVFFVGNSVGAMAGVLALAATNQVEKAALVSPAGHLTRILVETTDKEFKDPIDEALEAMGLAPGTPEYQQFIAAAQTLLDRADPVHYARHLAAQPLAEGMGLPVFFLSAGKDGLLPKGATRELICAARSGDAPLWKEYKDMCHEFLFHGCSGDDLDAASVQAVDDILAFFADEGTIEGAVDGASMDCQDL